MKNVSELIKHLEDINKGIESQLKVQALDRCNSVVVSNDFCYTINDNGKGYAVVGFIGGFDKATRFSQQSASELAAHTDAWNGKGDKIQWEVLPEREYLEKLVQCNQEALEVLRRYQ